MPYLSEMFPYQTPSGEAQPDSQWREAFQVGCILQFFTLSTHLIRNVSVPSPIWRSTTGPTVERGLSGQLYITILYSINTFNQKCFRTKPHLEKNNQTHRGERPFRLVIYSNSLFYQHIQTEMFPHQAYSREAQMDAEGREAFLVSYTLIL